jgi:dihydropteroate synthase
VTLMGILNVTPDSFSDGGRHLDPQAAARRALELQAEGAGLIDIGGESTRPGSVRIGEDEEWQRVGPVLELLSGAGLTIPLSIDTRNPAVAARALASGLSKALAPDGTDALRAIRVINHVALEHQPDRVRAMAELARDAGVSLILMHVRGRLETMHTLPPMADPVRETLEGLRRLRDIALARGLPQDRLLLDPGLGFGKNGGENYLLLRGLAAFHELGCRLVVGPSRKRFLAPPGGAAANRDAAAERDFATAAAVTEAVLAGCHVVRVHNVRAMEQVVRVAEKLSR